MSEQENQQDQEFEQIIEQRIRDNFAAPKNDGVDFSNERLKDMEKKLPEWSLEPPYNFLK